MKTVIAGVLMTGLSCCAQQAGTGFATSGGVRVNPVTDTVFEVIPRIGEEPSGLWRGAGEFARRELGAADTAQVYVVGGAGPGVTSGSRSAAQFSLLPPGEARGATGRNSRWGPQPGARATVLQARLRCKRRHNSRD